MKNAPPKPQVAPGKIVTESWAGPEIFILLIAAIICWGIILSQ